MSYQKSEKAIKNDKKSLIVLLIVFAASIILSFAFKNGLKVLFIIIAVISGLLSLVIGISQFKASKAYRSGQEKKEKKAQEKRAYYAQKREDRLNAMSPEDREEFLRIEKEEKRRLSEEIARDEQRREENKAAQEEIERQLMYFDKKTRKDWEAYYKAQKDGYKNFQKYKTPKEWLSSNENIKHGVDYIDYVKWERNNEDKAKWEEAHPGFVRARKIIKKTADGIGYVLGGEMACDIINALGLNPGVPAASIKKKDSPEQAAKDIRRMLNYSGRYSDEEYGSCKYVISDVTVKYGSIYVIVETSDFQLIKFAATYDVDFIIKSGLQTEIYNSIYEESGGFGLYVELY